jgi:hypothetical protein
MNKNFLAIVKAGYFFFEFEERHRFFNCLDDEPTGPVIQWLITVGIFHVGISKDQAKVRVACSLFDFSPERGSKTTQILCAFRHAEKGSELDGAMTRMMKEAKSFVANLAAVEAAELSAATTQPQAACSKTASRL